MNFFFPHPKGDNGSSRRSSIPRIPRMCQPTSLPLELWSERLATWSESCLALVFAHQEDFFMKFFFSDLFFLWFLYVPWGPEVCPVCRAPEWLKAVKIDSLILRSGVVACPWSCCFSPLGAEICDPNSRPCLHLNEYIPSGLKVICFNYKVICEVSCAISKQSSLSEFLLGCPRTYIYLHQMHPVCERKCL